MTPEQFDQMIRVAEARYHKAFDDIRPVLDQEARIRRDLKQLDDQQARNRKMLDGEVGLRAIGADILWQGWTEKARRELNTELAQVMARKIPAMNEVRKQFGRHQALLEMARKTGDDKRRARTRRFEEDLVQGCITNPYGDRAGV